MENDIVLHLTIGEDITKDKRCKNKNLVKLEKVDYYYLKLKKVIENVNNYQIICLFPLIKLKSLL